MIEVQNVERFFVGDKEFKSAAEAQSYQLQMIFSEPCSEVGGNRLDPFQIAQVILHNRAGIIEVLSDKPRLRKRAKRKAKPAAADTTQTPPSSFKQP